MRFYSLSTFIVLTLENAKGRGDGKYNEKRSANDGNCLLRNVLGDVSSTDHSNASSDATIDNVENEKIR